MSPIVAGAKTVSNESGRRVDAQSVLKRSPASRSGASPVVFPADFRRGSVERKGFHESSKLYRWLICGGCGRSSCSVWREVGRARRRQLGGEKLRRRRQRDFVYSRPQGGRQERQDGFCCDGSSSIKKASALLQACVVLQYAHGAPKSWKSVVSKTSGVTPMLVGIGFPVFGQRIISWGIVHSFRIGVSTRGSNRNCDLSVRSRTLYPLSYAG